MVLPEICSYIVFSLLTMVYFVEQLVSGHAYEWLLFVVMTTLYMSGFPYGKWCLIYALLNMYMYGYYDGGNVWYR